MGDMPNTTTTQTNTMPDVLEILADLHPDVDWAAVLAKPGRATNEDTAAELIRIGCDRGWVANLLLEGTSHVARRQGYPSPIRLRIAVDLVTIDGWRPVDAARVCDINASGLNEALPRHQRFADGMCRRGHDVTDPANVYVWNGVRRCAVCQRANSRRSRARIAAPVDD
jgi:hypothetical protein